MSIYSLRFPPHRDGLHRWNATASPLIKRCTRLWRDDARVPIEPTRQQQHLHASAHQSDLWLGGEANGRQGRSDE